METPGSSFTSSGAFAGDGFLLVVVLVVLVALLFSVALPVLAEAAAEELQQERAEERHQEEHDHDRIDNRLCEYAVVSPRSFRLPSFCVLRNGNEYNSKEPCCVQQICPRTARQSG